MGRMKDWMMDMEEAIYDEMHMNPAAGPDAVVSEAKMSLAKRGVISDDRFMREVAESLLGPERAVRPIDPPERPIKIGDFDDMKKLLDF